MLSRLFRSEYTLTHPLYVAFKSALAVFLALSIDAWTGNSDHVSAAFIAVLSIAPTVYQGLRQAALQFMGSVAGGVFGALGMALFAWQGWPMLYAMPPAVFCAILAAFFLRQPSAYIVAAFTALFLPNFRDQTPLSALEIRLLAVATGAASGFVVNTVVSAFAHGRIFGRRRRKLYTCLFLQLNHYSDQGPAALAPVFGLSTQMETELKSALLDLRHTRQKKAIQLVQQLLREMEQLIYVLHLINQLYYGARRTRCPDEIWSAVLVEVQDKIAIFCPPEIRSALPARIDQASGRSIAVADLPASIEHDTALLLQNVDRLCQMPS